MVNWNFIKNPIQTPSRVQLIKSDHFTISDIASSLHRWKFNLTIQHFNINQKYTSTHKWIHKYIHTNTQNWLNCTYLRKWHYMFNLQNDTSCLNMEVWHMVALIENDFNIQTWSHAQIWSFGIWWCLFKMGPLTTYTFTTIIFILKVDLYPLTRRRSSTFFLLVNDYSLLGLHKEPIFLLDSFYNKLHTCKLILYNSIP